MKWTLLAISIAATGCSKDDPDPAPAPTEPVEPKPAVFDAAAAPAPKPVELSWLTDEPTAVETSRAAGKPLFIDISATWCKPCMELEEKTFPAPEVAARLKNDFVLLRIDVTEQTDATEALQKKYGAEVLPVLVVLAPGGKQLVRINSFVEPDELLAALDGV